MKTFEDIQALYREHGLPVPEMSPMKAAKAKVARVPVVAETVPEIVPEAVREAAETAAEEAVDRLLQEVEIMGNIQSQIARLYDNVDIPKLEKVVESSESIAKWMDKRMGDAAIGAIPFGEALTVLPSLYIVYLAHQAGVPREEIKHMLVKIILDEALPGIVKLNPIPIVNIFTYLGTVAFNAFFKSNTMNATAMRTLLERVKEEREKQENEKPAKTPRESAEERDRAAEELR